MDRKKQVELLAPAGSPDGLYGALHAGADAVYLAGDRFGARVYADNFTQEELLAGLRYGHLLGKKIYLTVNTLLKEAELQELYDYLEPLYQAGLDGVIIQDLGVFTAIREQFPQLELHVSTQMSLCSSFGAAYMKQMGASRIVPARELSLEEIRSIKSKVDIEIESFIHGAMCYCYSGQCLFSSILGGRSGNRGRCAQPCRLPYSVNTGAGVQKGHFLSLKDMCTIQNIPALIHAGIDSFKIEGRMKRPEYAAGTVAVYRRAIDRYYDLESKHGAVEAAVRFHVDQKDLRLLSSLYIRSQVQEGYYFQHNGKEMVTIESPAYSETEESVLQQISASFLQEHKKLPVRLEAYLYEGAQAVLNLSCGEVMVTALGEEVLVAQNRPLTEETVTKQLTRLGDTCFYAEDFGLQLSEQAFLPVAKLNELRRQGIQYLEEALLRENGYEVRSDAIRSKRFLPGKDESGGRQAKSYAYTIGVETLSQMKCVVSFLKKHRVGGTIGIYVKGDLLLEHPLEELIPDDCGADVFIALPPVLREYEEEYIDRLVKVWSDHPGITGFQVRTVDELGAILKKAKGCSIHTDTNLYCFNSKAFESLKGLADLICLPYELRNNEANSLISMEEPRFEKIVYGRIPMMVTANCVVRTTEGCRHEDGRTILLKDRMGKDFPVVTNCRHCLNTIYNSVPLYLARERTAEDRKYTRSIRFTVEENSLVEEVLEGFLLGEEFAPKDYTTGHEKRGVE